MLFLEGAFGAEILQTLFIAPMKISEIIVSLVFLQL